MGGWTRRIVSRCVQYGPTLILIIFTDKELVFSHVVEKHPIGDGLKAFRDSFTPNEIERLG